MGAEKPKIDIFDDVPTVEKAKVAIVGWIDEKPAIFTLVRSEFEETRVGEDDWAGGSLDPGEKQIDALLRETGEELPGVMLRHITELKTRRKTITDPERDIVVERKISYLFAAIADFPPGELSLSREHSAGGWVPLDEYPGRNIPPKYINAVTSPEGLLIINGLALIARHEPQPQYETAPELWLPPQYEAPVPELLAA